MLTPNMKIMACDPTEDELRAAIKAMIDEMAHVNQGNWEWLIATADADDAPPRSGVVAAIDAIHASRKRHPTEWPETKP